jgi:hypothetical protein
MRNLTLLTMKQAPSTLLRLTVLLSCLPCFEPNASAQSHDKQVPILSCHVEPQNPQQENRIVEISNLRQFNVSITLFSPDWPVAPMTIAADGRASQMAGKVNTEVIVREVGTPAGQIVPLVITVTGVKRDLHGTSISVVGQIPIDELQRWENINAYLKWVETDAAMSEHTSIRTLGDFKKKRAEIAKALERIYIENRVGTYELICKYSSNLPGYWQGDVQSEAIVFRVRRDGTFFDQPAFKTKQSTPKP